MFGSRRKRIQANHTDSLIGQQTEIHGDVRFSGDLVVLGAVYGNVIATVETGCVLSLSETGRVEGEIRVPNVMINGVVVGDVYSSEHVQLAESARIDGNVYYRLIEVEMGAAVNGSLVHMGEVADARLKLRHEPPAGNESAAKETPALEDASAPGEPHASPPDGSNNTESAASGDDGTGYRSNE